MQFYWVRLYRPPILNSLQGIHKSLHVLEQVSQAGPRLLAAGLDLGRGEDETAVARVAELNSHRVRSFGIFGRVVDRGAGNLVQLANMLSNIF